ALTRATRDINIGDIQRLKGTRKQAEEIMKLVPQSGRLQAFNFDANYTWATNPQVSQYRYCCLPLTAYSTKLTQNYQE
ncbi:hypothetical protein, partial [Nostoc sp. 'Peltigera malacea cyanobiont' DB3992]|uniref:hypothetical protein n=1 Tax=Nostoc sp. 'Peltigera malacea cyanobiont' DB3992 TaxID=1206980 RepID=UPI0027BA06D7